MRKLVLAIICLAPLIAFAQTDSTQAEKKFRNFVARVKTMDNISMKGILYIPTSEELVISKSVRANANAVLPNETISIPAENIQSFTIKRKKSVLKGALLGFGIGAVTGVIIGFASGDDPIAPYPDPADDFLGLGSLSAGIQNAFAMTAGEKAVAGGAGLGVTGAIVGTVVGALVKKKFIINGKKEKFRDLQAELMTRLYTKSPAAN